MAKQWGKGITCLVVRKRVSNPGGGEGRNKNKIVLGFTRRIEIVIASTISARLALSDVGMRLSSVIYTQ